MRLDGKKNAGVAFSVESASSAKAGNAPLHLLVPSAEPTTSESSFHVRDAKHALSSPPTSPYVLAPNRQRQLFKRVRFHTVPQVHEVPNLESMSNKLKKDTWYRKKDLKRIQNECRQTRSLIRRGGLVADNEDQCVLGLADDAHPYARQRAMHKLFVRSLVLEEQERQRQLSQKDVILLAAKSMEFSSRCRHASFVASLPRDRTPNGRGYVN